MLFTWVIIAAMFAPQAKTDLYVGSTPCDAEIKSMLKIPFSAKCEFIKWQLQLSRNAPDTFYMSVNYGESKPNTNGFMNGGMNMTIRGTYTRKADGLILHGEKNTLFLIKIDNNILHFADSNKKLLIGNGGWGYVLNKRP